jgi:tRNA dimethylallyltransferase
MLGRLHSRPSILTARMMMSTSYKASNDFSLTSSKYPLVVVLAGATAAGKSAVATEICKLFPNQCEIVVADAVQVYKNLDIGANKPTLDDQKSIPHHLVSICDTSRVIDAAEFCCLADVAIRDILHRKKIPIVVGGSTMWIQWLVHGIPDAPKPTSSVSVEVLKLIGEAEQRNEWDVALSIVARYDTIRAKQLSRNDWYRLKRYLEIAISLENSSETISGKDMAATSLEARAFPDTLTGHRKPLLQGLDVRTFFLCEDREQLYKKIDNRCLAMLQSGLLEEVSELICNGTFGCSNVNHPASKAIGYRQSIAYLCNANNFGANSFQNTVEFIR